MGRIKRVAFALLAAVLWGAALSGCSVIEFNMDKWALEREASNKALAYVSETYGGKARVVSVRAGVIQVVFHGSLKGDALVTLSMDGEEFQVYVVGESCVDNRSGLALAQALDGYFRELCGLPPALEHDVKVYCKSEDFFASHTSDLGYDYNFLDFDYHGQPLEEVLPLLKSIRFEYRYVDDSVCLDGFELREEDWGGLLDSLRVRISCFRCYDENSEVPLGIRVVKGQPILMAEGMEFSRSESHFYADLDKIAYAVPYLSLRERLDIRDGQMTRERYTVTRMGNFWVSTSDGWSAEECCELRPCELDWAASIDRISEPHGVFYTREELEGDTVMASSTRDTLLPFVDARFEAVGEKLCLRDSAAERVREWAEEHPYSWQVSPLHVTVIPSLVYKSDAQMGVGKILEEDDGSHHGVNLFTYYLDRKKYWMNGLEFLTFTRPSELVLLRVVE